MREGDRRRDAGWSSGVDGGEAAADGQPHELRGKLQARWRMANQRVAAAIAGSRRRCSNGSARLRELDADAGRLVSSWTKAATPAGSAAAAAQVKRACSEARRIGGDERAAQRRSAGGSHQHANDSGRRRRAADRRAAAAQRRSARAAATR
ncbi:hypothetical protein Scep_013642 [Stephania cephalantha]|uniref:Uncharacterized protein n=1 Tax=Stephania cephalantha TaxID=152367 RepID=A0AAP0JHL0_9MAGN